MAKFPLDGSHWLGGQAAGDDEIEETEVSVHVEGKAVGRDGAGNMNADGGDLGGFSVGARSASPDAGEFGNAGGRNAEVSAGTNEGFFHFSNEFDSAEGFALAVWCCKGAQVEDRVADELVPPVESDVAPAVAFDDFDAALDEEVGGGEDVRGPGIAPQGNNRGVFK